MKRLLSAFVVFVVLMFSLCSCAQRKQVSDEMFALDTIITFKITDNDEQKAKDTIQKCKDEIVRLEELFSATKENTDIYNINHLNGQKVKVNSETARLLESCVEISDTCNGAFDISIYPLVQLWGFDTKEYVVPSNTQIKKTLKSVNYKDISITEDDCVTLREGMSIDLGAVAKGYIAERLREIMAEQGVFRGVINLGGMVVLYNADEISDNFSVGVEYPDSGEIFCTFDTSTPFTVTSGAYQRYFEKDGNRYHHIIDPSSGYPSDSDISSVTLVTDDAVSADALSTAFYVMGIEKTLEYLDNHSEKSVSEYDFIILNSNKNELYISENLERNGFELERDFEDKITVKVI